MAFVVSQWFDNAPRQTIQRAAADCANAAAALGLNRILTSGAIAIGTTTTKVQAAADITFTIGGAFFLKGDTDDLWTLSGSVVPASSWQKYLLLLDSAGTASIQEATPSQVSADAVSWTNVNHLSPWGPLLSVLDDGKVIAGVLTIATDATHTFTPGTTALSATGITDTYTNGIDGSLLPLIGNTAGSILGSET